MIGKILCFFLGHRIDRLDAFKDTAMIQAIDPIQKKIMKVDYCLRCNGVHVRIEEYVEEG